jgi:hypothetical protein
MKLQFFLLLIFGFYITTSSIAQKTYYGTLVTKLGQELAGAISVNLQGANDDLIQISSVEKSKNNGSKETTTTKARFNTAIIKYIKIDSTIYYFRNINTEYGKSVKNVCVRLITGTIDCGLFETGDGTTPHSVAIKFPKSSVNELTSADYYDEASFTVAIQFGECKNLYRKIMDRDETVYWTENTSVAQRNQAYRNIISEYNSCM